MTKYFILFLLTILTSRKLKAQDTLRLDTTKTLQEVIITYQADKLTSIKNYELPPEKKGVKLISPDSPEQLIELLHNEAKVI